jgi:hypothetical protein
MRAQGLEMGFQINKPTDKMSLDHMPRKWLKTGKDIKVQEKVRMVNLMVRMNYILIRLL